MRGRQTTQIGYLFPLCSYKLWYHYLKLRRKQVKGKCITDICYEEVNNAFERALVFMHKVSTVGVTLHKVSKCDSMSALVFMHKVSTVRELYTRLAWLV